MTDKERIWLDNVLRTGGSFLLHFARACYQADDANFEIIRPVLERLMVKYSEYSRAR